SEEIHDRDDLDQQGINTTRGRAADAIGNLLFAYPERLPELEDAVTSLVVDDSSAVRSCAVRPLLAILNIDRDRSVGLFCTCVSDAADGMLRTPRTLHFLYYALTTHYAAIRDVLVRMLDSEDCELRNHAGRLIALSRLGNDDVEPEFLRALEGCEAVRKGAVGVFSANLAGEYGDFCRDYLFQCFEDPAKEVRQEAVHFLDREGFDPTAQEEVVAGLVKSRAFPEGAEGLWRMAKKLDGRLPDVVADALAKAVDLLSDPDRKHARIEHDIPELVMRMYHQAHTREAKDRCLDVIDKLARQQAYGIEEQLANFER
ncbi:MAG: hypothetical protein HN341_01270, partial [Verrucomicrobia bacterium]|nr:hypothetical protein [Verrucomicrobiota bacterium]